MKILRLAWLLVLPACGGSADSASSGGGGGGVSFGGAQDIGQFKGILDTGGVPGPDTLDANGFFNEHFAPVPAAPCTDKLCLTPGLSVGRDWLLGNHQATLQIAVDTNVDPSTYTRLPMNLVVVVDTSGSMAEDGRLDKVKVGLDTLIDNLEDTDRLAIVNFDDAVTTDTGFGQTLDRPALHAIVASLAPGGGTDIFDGLHAGFTLVGDAPSDHQNRVILLSDGNATSGDTSTTDILAMADGFVGKGVGLTTVGVGLDFDVELMRGLAEHGAGNFYFLEDASAATEVFTEELDYFVSPLALNVQISAIPGPGYRLGEQAGSHLWTNNSDGGSMSIPAVFIASRTSGSGQGRRGAGSMIFIHLDPTGLADGTGKVADLKLSYQPIDSANRVTQTVALTYANDPAETPDTPYLSIPEMAKRYAMYNMFLGFHTATESEDLNCAVATLNTTRTNALAWNAEQQDEDITADIALLDEYLTNLADAGATADSSTPLVGCAAAGDPYGNGNGNGVDEEPARGGLYACSAGGSPSGLAGLALVLLVAIRRRRR
ncbi:MAG TPA: VWA domain-containing protein [Kofleriaceae bacterium]|nr:VWA domain-containing protein [Kofleriaceae bacterium]